MDCAFRTHVGKVRAHNEDFLLCLGDLGVMVLGDGMGGHRAGEVASKIAVEAAASELLAAQQADCAGELESLMCVGQAGESASEAVFSAVEQSPELQGMGTTLVLAMFREERVFFAHVGDSRLYRLRDGRLRSLTRDHSLVQELLDSGLFGSREEAAEAGIGDNILTRSVGLDRHVEVDVGDVELQPGDRFLLCSDGLCGKVADSLIGELLGQGDDLDRIADALLQAALDAGGRDNISLIVARRQAA